MWDQVPKAKLFAPTKPSVNFEQVDAVLGETTLDGIQCVLGISELKRSPQYERVPVMTGTPHHCETA